MRGGSKAGERLADYILAAAALHIKRG